MKLAVVQVAPIFPHSVLSGSLRTLHYALKFLGSKGHTVNVYCMARADNSEPFHVHPNVIVYPVLRFKETYPEPYLTAPYYLAQTIHTIHKALEVHDCLFVSESQLLFNFVHADIPTAVAVQDYVYAESLVGALNFQADRLIVTSEYVRDCVRATLGSYRDVEDRISVVPNGFDTTLFRPVRSSLLRDRWGLPDGVLPILYPHRPDARKGIYQVIDVLVKTRGFLPKNVFDSLRLFVPQWSFSDIDPDDQNPFVSFSETVQGYAQERGVGDKLYFHEWLPLEWLPAYYSMGAATLCIGNFIEAFGNVSVESELCGCPAIVSRVGAQRHILPEGLVSKVDYGDSDCCASLLSQLLLKGKKDPSPIRDYVDSHYSLQAMMEGYASCLENTRQLPCLNTNYLADLTDWDLVGRAPWVYCSANGVYNDYKYGYRSDSLLAQVLARMDGPITVKEIVGTGITQGTLGNWLDEGYLVRCT